LSKLGSSIESLVSKMRGTESGYQRLQRETTFLNSILPNFGSTIEANNKANKRTLGAQVYVTGGLYDYFKSLKDSGASQQKILSEAHKYINGINQNTAALQQGTTLQNLANNSLKANTSAATSSANPATRQTQAQKMGMSTANVLTAARTQAGSAASTTSSPISGSLNAWNAATTGVKNNTAATVANTNANKGAAKSAMDVVNNNKMFAASMATSLIAGFLPAVDENSGAMLRLTHSLLGLVTTITSVGFALEAFGLKLNKSQIMDFLSGKGKGISGSIVNKTSAYARAGTSALGRGLSSVQIPGMPTFSKGLQSLGGQLTKLAPSVGKAAGSFMSLLGPLVAIAGSAFVATKAFEAAIEAVYNFEGRLKMAVEAGNIDKAKAVAGERASFQGANVVRGGGATAGAVLGFILGGPIGAAIGAGLGAAVGTLAANLLPEGVLDSLNVMFGGDTRASAIALAAAQAGAVKTQKELEKAQKTATNAMQDFENGSINASEALSRIRTATAEATKQEKRASDFAISNLENRASDGFTGRNIASTLTFGMVESSSARNQRLGQQSAEQIRQSARFQNEAFQMESGARAATIRSGFARGRSRSEIEAEATGNLRNRRTELLQNAQKALRAGDEQSANAFNEAAEQLRGQIEQVEREMANLEKEVLRAKAAFDAMNL